MTQAATPLTANAADDGPGECWCCGRHCTADEFVRLGNHAEAGVCLRCAHYLHWQARQREDALRPSIAGRLRGTLIDPIRRIVVARGWHQKPVIGAALRWLGRHL